MRPCPTMLVVHTASEEAKVEAVISEYVTLKHTRDARNDRGYAAGEFDEGYRVYVPGADIPRTGRGGAAAPTWIIRGDESRGCDGPWRRVPRLRRG